MLAFGLGANAFGTWLWSRRETLAPYPAIQMLLAACGVAALLTVLALSGTAPELGRGERLSPWILLLFPGLMVTFHLRERAARRATT